MDSSLTVKKLSDADLVWVASPAYLAAKKGLPQDWRIWINITAFAKGREPYPWALKNWQENIVSIPSGSFLTGDAEHIRAAVLCDLGIAQVPFWVLADEIRDGRMRILLPERSPMNIVYPAGRRMPMRLRVFIDYLIGAFAVTDISYRNL